jgi:hypothetical protein
MPNWFTGKFTITGSQEKLLPFRDWASLEFDDFDDEKNSFNQFVPLPTENGEWVWDVACSYWGSKWGVSQILYVDNDDEEITIGYQSAWTAPTALFARLEKKYGVIVEAEGAEQEGCPHIVMFHNGKSAYADYDYDEVYEYAKERDDNIKTADDFDDEDEFQEYKSDISWHGEWLDEYLESVYSKLKVDKSRGWGIVDIKDKTEEKDNIDMIAELVADAINEEEEEEVEVHYFDHEGTTYLRDDNNMLYDCVTHDEVGVWNPETKTIDKIENDEK